MIKKMDIAIIVVLLILSFIPVIVFGVFMGHDYDRTYAEITVEGKFYKKVPLSEHTGTDVMEIKYKNHINKISINEDNISMIEADCSDSLCIYQGEISKVGQSIVCLPNKVMIEIKGNKIEESDDDVILSH